MTTISWHTSPTMSGVRGYAASVLRFLVAYADDSQTSPGDDHIEGS